MKKLLALLVALFAVIAIPGMAAAQTTVTIAFFSTVVVPNGSVCVISGKPVPSSPTSTECWQKHGFGFTSPGVHVVNIRPDNSIGLFDGFTSTLLRPGTRLQILSLLGTCLIDAQTYRVFSGVVANPTQLGVALVVAPSGVTLLPDDEAVVKSDEDGTGIADVVCVQPGSPALHTELWSDIPLLRGDRLSDFQFLFYDPATGETYYDAYLEY